MTGSVESLTHGSSAAALDRAAMTRWLTRGPIVSPDGDVLSWHNPARPGYPYPEIAGLWLQLAAARRSPAAPRVRARLVETVRADAIGRDGVGYLFDEGAALAGLLACGDGDDGAVPFDAVSSLHARVVRGIADGIAVRASVQPARWSTTFGPHLLKLVLPLRAWAEGHPGREADAAIATLTDRLLDRFTEEGRALTQPDDERTYVHACCYALEGLLGLAGSRHDSARARAIVRAGAAFLARIQRRDGALPTWHDDDDAPAAGDATAQAVRIWSCVDPRAFAVSCERALAHLAGLATPAGGLRYRSDSSDVNTWTTIFAVQALDFVEGGAFPGCLI